jgi:hypothetical protein
MRETPRDGAESPQEQYEQLLQQGIAIQTQLATHLNDEEQLRKAGKDGEAGALAQSQERRELLTAIQSGLAARVALLRNISPDATIEAAFPRVRGETPEQQMSRSTGEIAALFETGGAPLPATVEAGRALTEDEMQQFEDACVNLAEKTGYPGSYWSYGMLALSRTYAAGKEDRNFVRVDLLIQPYPSTDGITGHSRITGIDVSDLKWGGSGEKMVMQYGARVAVPDDEANYKLVCTDPIVQKEIDRAIAIFG